MDELKKLLEELSLGKDDAKPRPIKTGKGLIAYRKYLWALKFITDKIVRLRTYKEDVLKDIDNEIERQEKAIKDIKGAIKEALIQEPIADKTKTGGRTLKLPDIATMSLSKIRDKVYIDDEKSVLDTLGQEFAKIKVSLDKTKAKRYILETGKMPEGATKTQERTLSIRFKR